MASTQQIKARIKSVKNTKQITKAMEMVAASKMRRAQDATLASRDYTLTARQILTRLRELTDVSKHPLFTNRAVKSRILVVITSDRGLAGAYNSNVLRRLTKELKSDLESGIKTELILIGKQAAKFSARVEGLNILGSYDRMPEKPTIGELSPILQTVKNRFTGRIGDRRLEDEEGEGADPQSSILNPQSELVDCVDVLFTDFKSSVVQEVAQTRLLPAAFSDAKVSEDLDNAIFEPSPKAVLDTVAERLVDVQLWQAYLESQASEQSSRMLAMKTASDNAGDLIDDLTLAANSARQSAITQELAEITGGAEAMK
ncbi:MAG: F-type H+-transporting ATPase subunit gamma [Candidatus Saccharimonadales bacterium]|jgi:F-type H+-transporting ATPase subunit gamma